MKICISPMPLKNDLHLVARPKYYDLTFPALIQQVPGGIRNYLAKKITRPQRYTCKLIVEGLTRSGGLFDAVTK